MAKSKKRQPQMQRRQVNPLQTQAVDMGGYPTLNVDEISYAVMAEAVEKYWLDIASFAYTMHYQQGRGAVRLVETADDEVTRDYVTLEQLRGTPAESDVANYNPNTQVVILYQVSDSHYVCETFMEQPSPADATTLAARAAYYDNWQPRDITQPRPVRLPDVNRYEEVVEIANRVTQSLVGTLPVHREDVLHLAIKLLGHARTIYRLSQEPNLLVPRLGDETPMVDIASVSSIFRIAIETYLTMHEVFFAPPTDDAFTFYHARWILAGFEEIARNFGENAFLHPQADLAAKLRQEHQDRMKSTTYFQTHNKPQHLLKAKRTKEDAEWDRLALSAQVPKSFMKKMHTAQHGYVHSDGYAALKTAHLEDKKIDLDVDWILFGTMTLLAKMSLDLVSRYPATLKICKESPDTFAFLELLERTLKETKDE